MSLRTYLITGSASGIGRATAELLKAQGHRVIGVDIHDADITVDLATHQGRETLVEQARALSGGTVDAVIANAGVTMPPHVSVSVNYFGALATVNGLRPLLNQSDSPRAVTTLSGALLSPPDPELLEHLAAEDEESASVRIDEMCEEMDQMAAISAVYATSKRALAQWLRRVAPTAEWAGEGIALNAVAPGWVDTPLVKDALTEDVQDSLKTLAPLNGLAQPKNLAHTFAWLTSPECTHVCGQILYVDGGAEVVTRGDRAW
ncbi:SDR family oxidoreductase [Nesterenkonia alba]|uniref:SDR family oxidoreductase n=1 Tax=Nesterenkonia alba TaxID=515814 RepID=UPI0003B5A2B9|nr:SDR family oxidoreductase [Nesterenkonia alba]